MISSNFILTKWPALNNCSLKFHHHFSKSDPNTIVIDEEQIIHQFLTFFFAGMDTTSQLSGMTIYELAKHPEIVAEIRREFNEKI